MNPSNTAASDPGRSKPDASTPDEPTPNESTADDSRQGTILLVGASGLVGQGILAECLADPSVSRILCLVRRPSRSPDPRIEELVAPDFMQLDAVAPRMAEAQACFYCAGAPPIGTPEAQYRHVTLHVTMNVARTYAQARSDGRMLYVSGAGSDTASRVMPLRIKGETEQALLALPLPVTCLRTGGIRPAHAERSPHALLRAVWAVASPIAERMQPWLPTLMTSTADVGRAMLKLSRMSSPPCIVENAEIERLAVSGS